jgi:hypothetical protein
MTSNGFSGEFEPSAAERIGGVLRFCAGAGYWSC